MIIIPAVDIKNGKCVRLSQGRMDSETVFSDNPAAMAKRWEDEGAEIIHVVDLDGAIEKSPKNLYSIRTSACFGRSYGLEFEQRIQGSVVTFNDSRNPPEYSLDWGGGRL